MRREMDRRFILIKVVAQDSGIPYDTLLTYFPADATKTPVQIPGSAIFALCGAIPDDILSLLLPDGRLIVQVAEGVDHNQVATAMVDYLADKQQAHHPDSECGPAIGPTEDNVLRAKFARVRAVAA